MFDLAIDLSQSFLTAHGQYGVSEAHEEDDQGEFTEPGNMNQPAQRLAIERNHSRVERVGGPMNSDLKHRDRAPDDQQDDHDGRDDHDLYRFLAGFVNALDVLPPEIECNHHTEQGSKSVIGKMGQGMTEVGRRRFYESREVLSRRDGADGSGQNVIEQQCRHGKLG